jgi:hypothetical protein
MRISGDDNEYRVDSAAPSYFTEMGQAPLLAGTPGLQGIAYSWGCPARPNTPQAAD